MKTAALALAIAGLLAAPLASQAGVAPSHDQSQLSQSGAKIAPPQKSNDTSNTETSKKDEKDKEQDKEPKR